MRPFKRPNLSIEDEFNIGRNLLVSIEHNLDIYNNCYVVDNIYNYIELHTGKPIVSTEGITEFLSNLAERIKLLFKQFLTWLKKVATKIRAYFNTLNMRCKSYIKDLGSVLSVTEDNIGIKEIKGVIILDSDIYNENYIAKMKRFTTDKIDIDNRKIEAMLNVDYFSKYFNLTSALLLKEKNNESIFVIKYDNIITNLQVVITKDKHVKLLVKNRSVDNAEFLNNLLEETECKDTSIAFDTNVYNVYLSNLHNLLSSITNSLEDIELSGKYIDFVYYHEQAHSLLYQTSGVISYSKKNASELTKDSDHVIKYINDTFELQADAYAMLKTGMSINELVDMRFNMLSSTMFSRFDNAVNNKYISMYTNNIKKQLPMVKKFINLSLIEKFRYLKFSAVN